MCERCLTSQLFLWLLSVQPEESQLAPVITHSLAPAAGCWLRVTDSCARINSPSASVRSAPQILRRAQVNCLCRPCLSWTAAAPNVSLNQALLRCFVHESSCLVPSQLSLSLWWSTCDILTSEFFVAMQRKTSCCSLFSQLWRNEPWSIYCPF